MNAYVVRTRDERTYTEPVMDDGSGPQFPYLPIAPVVAETPAQAKRIFLQEFTHRASSGELEDHDGRPCDCPGTVDAIP